MMLKSKFLKGSILAAFIFGVNISGAQALELDEDTRTVVLDTKGSTVVMTPEQVKRGKRLFNMSWMYTGTSMDTIANSRDTHIFSTPEKKT